VTLGALASSYHVAPDFAGAIAKAVNAGVDVSMTPNDFAGWQAGSPRMSSVVWSRWTGSNQSVRRILRLKFQLGLFDHPYVDASLANAAVTPGGTPP